MNKLKHQQRHNLKKLRLELSVEQVIAKSKLICLQAYKLIKELSVSSVHVYLPIADNKEVTTWELIEKLLDDGISVSTSIYSHDKSLRHVSLQKDTIYEVDKFGIPFPIKNFTHDEKTYQALVVPLLGFDESLHRIGYGMGVYDRFLKVNEKAFKLGLGYEISKVKTINNEAHDVKLDVVLTEKKLYN